MIIFAFVMAFWMVLLKDNMRKEGSEEGMSQDWEGLNSGISVIINRFLFA